MIYGAVISIVSAVIENDNLISALGKMFTKLHGFQLLLVFVSSGESFCQPPFDLCVFVGSLLADLVERLLMKCFTDLVMKSISLVM